MSVINERGVGLLQLVSVCAVGFVLLLGGVRATTASAEDLCPNAAFRTGASANLSDCRAYELVTPADMDGLRPYAANYDQSYMQFPSSALSSTENSVVFHTIAGTLPSFEGTGFTDRYRAVRGDNGWTTGLFAPTAAQARLQYPAGIEPLHGAYFFSIRGFNTGGEGGSLFTQYGGPADLLRRPDGKVELIAQGSLGQNRGAAGVYISPGAEHIIFNSKSNSPDFLGDKSFIQLESNAPPTGTAAIYDRSLDGPTEVISLLPGNKTPLENEDAIFEGVSKDGKMVAFKLSSGPSLYVRADDETYEVTPAENTFAGISRGGEHVFYANAASTVPNDQTPADLFSFDTFTQATKQITSVGDARFVNVSDDGSHVYFVSETPIGGEGAAGLPNLFVWERTADETSFIGTLDPQDLTSSPPASEFQGGPNVARWTSHAMMLSAHETSQISPGNYVGPGKSTSRSTPDGTVLVFESRAQLTAADNAGNPAIYRYDAADTSLECISCRAGGAPSQAGSSLQSVFRVAADPLHPVSAPYIVANLTNDGETIFFQSLDSLVSADSGPGQEIYRWKEGDIALISGGSGTKDSFLYAASSDGSDVLFVTYEQLLPQDENVNGAIYDARVGGGFPGVQEDVIEPCVGDACQGAPGGAPAAPQPASSTATGKNVKPKVRRRCGKGKRRVRRAGKVRCVKRQRSSRSRRGKTDSRRRAVR